MTRLRIRRSTAALCGFFLLTLAVYLFVRPNSAGSAPSGDHASVQQTASPAPARPLLSPTSAKPTPARQPDGHTIASPGSDGAGERNGDAHRHDAGPSGRDSPSHAISIGLGLGLGRNVASAVATPPAGRSWPGLLKDPRHGAVR